MLGFVIQNGRLPTVCWVSQFVTYIVVFQGKRSLSSNNICFCAATTCLGLDAAISCTRRNCKM